VSAELPGIQACDDCSTETPEVTRPCSGCGVDVVVCPACVESIVVKLQKPYMCAFCRFVQQRATDEIETALGRPLSQPLPATTEPVAIEDGDDDPDEPDDFDETTDDDEEIGPDSEENLDVPPSDEEAEEFDAEAERQAANEAIAKEDLAEVGE
jgi:hypothetical protein